MNLSDLPSLNAALNFVSAVLLSFGYYHIRRGNAAVHKRFMLAALVSSGLFLSSYLIYHYEVGSVPYPYHDWTRPVYFVILIPHVILAALMTPFIVWIVFQAFRENFARHRRVARWVWPVWMFVSVSGVLVYVMLYLL